MGKLSNEFKERVMAAYANPNYPVASQKLFKLLEGGTSNYLKTFLEVGAKMAKIGPYEALFSSREPKLLNKLKKIEAEHKALYDEYCNYD